MHCLGMLFVQDINRGLRSTLRRPAGRRSRRDSGRKHQGEGQQGGAGKHADQSSAFHFMS